MTIYHPWRHAGQHPQLLIAHLRLPQGSSWWLPADRAIVLDDRLLQVERRCRLAHELIHAEDGDEHLDDPVLDARREVRVRRQASRLLIDLQVLGEALAWHGEQNLTGVADECWVDMETLRARLDGLHPAERGYLRRRLAAREDAA